MYTADAQEWFGLGLLAIWVVAAVVTASGLSRRPSRGTLVATGAGAALFAAYAGGVIASLMLLGRRATTRSWWRSANWAAPRG